MRHMNFHHLYYFWVVAKEGHLTRAAKRLHVSQSALSSQIRQLEDQLGQTLFTREARALHLTDAGQLALEYAEDIFNLGQEMQTLLQQGQAKQTERLRMGAVATLSRNFMDNFLRPLLGKPECQLIIRSASLDELLAQLKVHTLDLILSNRPITADSAQYYRCKLIATQSVCIVGPDTDRFKPLRFPQDLAHVPLLLPGPSSDIRTQFDLYCERENLDIVPYAEVDDMAMLRLLARDSGGMSVVPEVVVQDEIKSGRLKKYATLETVIENFYAITTRRKIEIPLLKQLLEHAQTTGINDPQKHD